MVDPSDQGCADREAAIARGEICSDAALDRAAHILASSPAWKEWLAYDEAADWHEALATGRRGWFDRFGEDELPAGVSPAEAAIDKAREIADERHERLLEKMDGPGTA